MEIKEYILVRLQVAVLNDLLPNYGGKTLENIIQGLNARIAEAEKEAELVGFPDINAIWRKEIEHSNQIQELINNERKTIL